MATETPLECATRIVQALDRMRVAEREAIEAADAMDECDEWPGRFFAATQGAASTLGLYLNGTSGSDVDLEFIYGEAVELRELLEIATLEDGLLVTSGGDDA